MNAILRVVNMNGMKDFDLSVETAAISELQFMASPAGKDWVFQCAAPIVYQGRKVTSGQICIGDAYFLDEKTYTKILILPKLTGGRKEIPFHQRLTVGRKLNNDLELKDPMVSGNHCVFVRLDGTISVQDEKSTNGTFVNRRLLRAKIPTPLKNGDEVVVGPYTLCVNNGLFIKNTNSNVHIHVNAQQSRTVSPGAGQYAVPKTKAYPWFSRAPRMYSEVPPLSIEIAEAPAIGEKPSMGMTTIAATNGPGMAIGLGMTALRYGLGKKKYNEKERQRAEVYAKYLTGIENQLKDHADQQRSHAISLHPDTADCVQRVNGPRQNLWERHPEDTDFLSLRLGVGQTPAEARVTIPVQRLQLQEDEFTHVPQQIRDKYAYVDRMPVNCSLMQDGICGVIGPRQQAVKLVQGMVAQIAALHSYDEVKLVVVFPEREREQWEWIRWLPHCMSKERDIRYIACDKTGIKEILPQLEAIVKFRVDSVTEWKFGTNSSNLPHYVFIVADSSLMADSSIGSALMLNRPELGLNGIIIGQTLSDFPYSTRNVITVAPSKKGLHLSFRKNAQTVELDSEELEIPFQVYQTFGRSMAPIRVPAVEDDSRNGIPSFITFFDGLRISKVDQIELGEFWSASRPEESMSVPIGVKQGGELFYFDIHEKAHGPHGLIAGGSGSGKSKLVQAWIAAMVMQFSPEDINFILVDFKGESLVTPFKGLPHLAGFTSNLDPDVRRKFLAVESEMGRRMALLKENSCDDIIQYRRKRRTSPQMPPMPFLFLVVDEYADFKTQYPEFTAPIDHLYQAGRSLGMMAILMTQNPSGKVTDQMRANLGFRWCLRVDQESDSREVLGTTDAAHIRESGRAYVKANDGTYVMIQALFGSTPYEPDKNKRRNNAQVFAIKLNGKAIEDYSYQEKKDDSASRWELSVLTEYVSTYCMRRKIAAARPIWMDTIPERLDLEEMQNRRNRMIMQEASSMEWIPTERTAAADSHPVAVLGLYDDPAHQVQDVLTHDFWNEGNLAVYGAATTGKTTFLQTVILSLCNRYTPAQVQFYLLECGGFAMRSLERFPHVGAAAGDDEPESIDKILKLLEEELERRRKLFRKEGITTLESYMEVTAQPMATVILGVDHMNLLGQSLSDMQSRIIKLSATGASYGVYLICSFAGTNSVNYQLLQNIRRVMALQLTDKGDYTSITGRVTADPSALPVGRGFMKTGRGAILFQTAIIHANMQDGERAVAIRRQADKLQNEWNGPCPAGIQIVPEKLAYGDLEGEMYLLGMNTETGDTLTLPALEHQSLMIAFGNEDGKEALYRSFLRQALEAGGEVWMYTGSPTGYSDLLDGEHLITELSQLNALVEPMAGILRERQAKYKQNPAMTFPPMLVLIDGMKTLLTQAEENTIMRLEVFVRLGKGIGFFLVCADTAADMNYCRYSGSSILAVTMRTRARMIVGGALVEHQLFENASLRLTHPQPLKGDEAVVLAQEGTKANFVKLMGGDSE